MSRAKINAKELEKQIRERKKLIMRFVNFVHKITREVGSVVHTDVGSSHTHVIRELRNFNGFSFLSDTGRTMFGGNKFQISYHPGREEVVLQQTKPVFDVFYQTSLDDESAEVYFDPSPVWRGPLEALIANKKKAISVFRRKEKENDKKFSREEARRERREELEKEAGKLGIQL